MTPFDAMALLVAGGCELRLSALGSTPVLAVSHPTHGEHTFIGEAPSATWNIYESLAVVCDAARRWYEERLRVFALAARGARS